MVNHAKSPQALNTAALGLKRWLCLTAQWPEVLAALLQGLSSVKPHTGHHTPGDPAPSSNLH